MMLQPLSPWSKLFAQQQTALLDTVEFFFRHLTPGQQWALERVHRLEECRDQRTGLLYGYRLIFNRPTKRILLQAGRLARRYRGIISRFDIALDIKADPSRLAELKRKIARQMVMKWRRSRPMRTSEDGGTIYWMGWQKGERRPNRNVVVYSKPDCLRLELRFLRPESVRRQGILSVADLLTVGPAALFARNVWWSDGGEAFVTKVLRNTIRKDIEWHRDKPFKKRTDMYRAGLKDRIPELLSRAKFDRAQIVKDKFPTRQLNRIAPPFSIPERLSWLEDYV